MIRRNVAYIIIMAALAASVLLSIAIARAEPPEGADMSLAPWYQSLKQPGSGAGCCSIADCRPVKSRVVTDHYEILIDEKWVAVPPDKILDHQSNPTGSAVACWTPYLGVLCFIRPTEF